MTLLRTARLELVPMTLPMVEAVILGRREEAEQLVGARMPLRWPNRELVERAFTASLEAIREDPDLRLWGDRAVVVRSPDEEARVVGSVVFHGRPEDGVAEVAYGVEEASQGRGFATEAVAASVAWALAEPGVQAVQAATFAWHVPSLRVIDKVGMSRVGTRDHETMGEMVVFEDPARDEVSRATRPLACRALLFDMDGLMVDSEPLWFEVEREFARGRGGDWTEELGTACIGKGLANTLRVMSASFGFPVDLGRDAAAIVELFVARVAELELKPGFDELLAEARARGVPRALASSSARRLVEATLARFGLRERFDAVVTGDCVAHPKPAPDIFLEAARRLGVPPGECVVLEDSLAGVRAARAAGMRVIAVPEGTPTDEMTAQADAVVSDLHGARALVVM